MKVAGALLCKVTSTGLPEVLLGPADHPLLCCWQMTSAALEHVKLEREQKVAEEARAREEAAHKAAFSKEFPSLQPSTPAPASSREPRHRPATRIQLILHCKNVRLKVPSQSQARAGSLYLLQSRSSASATAATGGSFRHLEFAHKGVLWHLCALDTYAEL
jgi:hypothetical protein